MQINFIMNINDDTKIDITLTSEDMINFKGKAVNDINMSNDHISISYDEDKIICINSIGTMLDSYEKRFKDNFIYYYNEKMKIIEESQKEGINYEEENDSIEKPYNVDDIRIDQKNFTINDIYLKIQQNKIDISPDFQRNFIWNKKQKCLFIESVLLRIPTPVIYLAQDATGKYHVIDGLQRLSTLASFMNNEFTLSSLEYLNNDCGKRFFSPERLSIAKRIDRKEEQCLSYKHRTRIEDTQLNCNIIDSSTPHEAIYDIFKRINTGVTKLNYQETRNCLATQSSRILLRTLADSDEFLAATGGSVSSKRMADTELVLRYIGFYISEKMGNQNHTYKGYMPDFLNKTLDIINELSDIEKLEISDSFINAMRCCYYVFGQYAFRKYDEYDEIYEKRKKTLNKSLFTAFAIIFSDKKIEQIKRVFSEHIDYNIKTLIDEMKQKPEYSRALTEGSSDSSQVKIVLDSTNKYVKSFLGAKYD